jgi:hypothetical protein
MTLSFAQFMSSRGTLDALASMASARRLLKLADAQRGLRDEADEADDDAAYAVAATTVRALQSAGVAMASIATSQIALRLSRIYGFSAKTKLRSEHDDVLSWVTRMGNVPTNLLKISETRNDDDLVKIAYVAITVDMLACYSSDVDPFWDAPAD